jgi:uncharacterized protein (TIGR02266 family)
MEMKTILLADDVALFLELEKTFFKRSEVELIIARNGREALALVQARRPDLVFIDLHMPEMNGDECCRLIKADPLLRHIPVVIVTQGGREDDLVRCRRAGCDDIVLKPINRHEFLATSHRYLAIPERGEQRYRARMSVHYGPEPGVLLTDFSINLSSGGLFLETRSLLPPDTTLKIEFILPGSHANVRCLARVAWLNHPDFPRNNRLPSGMGLQFLNLTVDDLDNIREFLRSGNLEPYW